MPAPIVIFLYKRVDTLTQTINSLKKCVLADESDLIIFSDGPKTELDAEKVAIVRKYASEISGFKNVIVHESSQNRGLARSIIEGVTDVFNQYESVIVLEDDLVLSKNFLQYMNACLEKYKNDSMCFSVSGYGFDLNIADYEYDVYFTMRHCSWGWGMWKDRWMGIDWSVKDYDEFVKSSHAQREFNKIGSDLSSSLKKQQKGKINSWAIRCNYHQFKVQKYTVYPVLSKVRNVGFDGEATHTTQRYTKYDVEIDQGAKSEFILPDKVIVNETILKKYKDKFSIKTRLIFKVLNMFR